MEDWYLVLVDHLGQLPLVYPQGIELSIFTLVSNSHCLKLLIHYAVVVIVVAIPLDQLLERLSKIGIVLTNNITTSPNLCSVMYSGEVFRYWTDPRNGEGSKEASVVSYFHPASPTRTKSDVSTSLSRTSCNNPNTNHGWVIDASGEASQKSPSNTRSRSNPFLVG